METHNDVYYILCSQYQSLLITEPIEGQQSNVFVIYAVNLHLPSDLTTATGP